MTYKNTIAMILAAAVLLSVCGCGQPTVSPDNLRLTASLRTALSARKVDWLEQNLAAVEKRRSEGKMADGENEAFLAIIEKAKAGKWEEAETRVIKLQKGQRPTPDQAARVAKHSH